jgi:hypothetical protein
MVIDAKALPVADTITAWRYIGCGQLGLRTSRYKRRLASFWCREAPEKSAR